MLEVPQLLGNECPLIIEYFGYKGQLLLSVRDRSMEPVLMGMRAWHVTKTMLVISKGLTNRIVVAARKYGPYKYIKIFAKLCHATYRGMNVPQPRLCGEMYFFKSIKRHFPESWIQ